MRSFAGAGVLHGGTDRGSGRKGEDVAIARYVSRAFTSLRLPERLKMANTIHVDVVSAEEQIFSGEAEFVVLPGVEGELGIFPRHTPLFTQIKPGAVRIKIPGQAQEGLVFVQGGFLEVQPHKVTVLADTAIRAHDLDEVKALEAKKRAEDAMANKESAQTM